MLVSQVFFHTVGLVHHVKIRPIKKDHYFPAQYHVTSICCILVNLVATLPCELVLNLLATINLLSLLLLVFPLGTFDFIALLILK